MDPLPNHRQQRGQILRKLTILMNTLAQADKDSRSISLEEIQVHLEQVADNKAKYEDIQVKIVSTIDNPTVSDDFTHEENFEAKFFELKSNLLTRLNAFNSVYPSSPSHRSPSADCNSTLIDSNNQFSRIVEQQNKILEKFNDSVLHMTNNSPSDLEHKLPALHIPSFSGKSEDWVSFHDLYVSLVHENERLSNIKKFQYLKTLVKDNAEGLLKHTLVTDANYEEAWEKLKQRFSKKIPIVTKQIQRFLDQPVIKEPNDAIAIRRLYDTSDEVVRALKSLKAEGRDPWLVHIALQKLNSDTKRLWAHENGDKDYDWKSFLAFLEKHCITLESCQQVSSKRVFSSNHSSAQGSSQRPAFSKTLLTQPDKCKLGCTESHGIFHCSRFLSSTVDERIQYIKKLNLCLNCFQRILWRFKSSDPVGVYEMNTITYGLSCSPHLSTRCLLKLAEDTESYPLAKRTLVSDVYIDDVLTGCQTVVEARELRRELKELLLKGGFNLRKWVSNSQEVLNEIPIADRELSDVDFNLDEEIKTLGLRWHPLNDNFQFTTFRSLRTPTKRIVLSEIAKLFDPLGLLGPTIITAKLLMQELWKRKCSWDDCLPEDLAYQWDSYQSMLLQSSKCIIPRRVTDFSEFCKLELHGFSDASEQAYGACIYIRAFGNSGLVSSHLLCSKSRVAPIKRVSLPRLELCGAHLLALLVKQITESINLSFDNIICWSDSTIVLAWISGDTNRWKTFVSNRVNEIVTICNPSIWNHVSTVLNPADLLTRSNDTSNLAKNSLWWHGPSFLLDSTLVFSTNVANISDGDMKLVNLELRPTKQSSSIALDDKSSILDSLINKYSRYSRLIHVLAYCLRFIVRTRKGCQFRLSLELYSAELILVKHIQSKYFPSEIDALKSNRSINKQYQSLSLYIDAHGVLRVGGRVSGRNPILLPSKDKFTQLLFEAEHRRLLHGGPQSLLASIRLKFWPLNGRDYARKTTRSCIECFHVKPSSLTQLMSELPEDRIRQNRAFQICGIDYGGPITILQSKGRGAKTTKAYIALFVCLTTKAIHLELVSELTTAAFLAALRRFISRRGRCSRIYSDNATNFVGAKGELKDLFKLLHDTRNKTEIQEFATNEGIEWRFIAAGSPHQGGLWEAGIKSTKHHLRRVLKTHTFNFEELNTLLVQIEACLNSRPLTPLSSDPNDLKPLTPAHFLIGESLMAIPDPDFIETKVNRLSRWQVIQQCIQHFWKRWSQEYLTTLYLRSKWKHIHENLKVGDMVLIRDENRPPLRWNLGRVSEVFLGSDQLVRTVKVKTTTGYINRAVHKLCKLPLQDSTGN